MKSELIQKIGLVMINHIFADSFQIGPDVRQPLQHHTKSEISRMDANMLLPL
jgi:hypothetical protein